MLARDDFDAREPRLGVMKHVHDDTFYLHKLKEKQSDWNLILMSDLLERFQCTYGCAASKCVAPAFEDWYPDWFREEFTTHRNESILPKRFTELWAGDRKRGAERPSENWESATAHHITRVLEAAVAWPWLNATCARVAVGTGRGSSGDPGAPIR